jgi:hypothetical protein
MMGGDHQLFQDVLDLVAFWIPQRAYGHERKFQSELQEFLNYELNDAGGADPLALDASGRHEHVVSTEHGKSYADVVVDDSVGIELKRDLSNSQTKKLRGQIEDYLDNYPFVIVCACGIDDMDGWRDLKNEYEGSQGMGLGLEQGGEVAFVHKKRENYGKDPDDVRGGGGLFGGGGLI